MLFLASVPGKTNASKKRATAKVSETGETYALEIEFTGKKPDTRIAKVDSREMMVAFRMKSETDDFTLGDGKQKFKSIRYERLLTEQVQYFLQPGTTSRHMKAPGVRRKKPQDICQNYEKEPVSRLRNNPMSRQNLHKSRRTPNL